MLWPDTFNNYFHPVVARAAVEVLEWAGYRVRVPRGPVCCGRPLYDYGMLDRAERQLDRTLRTLRPAIEAGIPIVGLEPSCLAVFRDELPNLRPREELARKLAGQSLLLSELLDRDGIELPPLRRHAIVHGHCHHKAVMGFDAEEAVLRKLGLDLEVLDSGCCGMAGSFGYERGHHDISMKIGEEALLPRVRAALPDDLIISDGFSCRAQIEGAVPRRPLHLAEVVHMAIHHGPDGPIGARPERLYEDERPRLGRWRAAALLAAGALLVGTVVWHGRRRV
jgi:Fe-S oxidoreductase